MKKLLVSALLLLFLSIIWFSGCKKDNVDPREYLPVSLSTPPGWPQPNYKFENNPLTSEGFKLGRKLFYDVRLSRDYSTSCGSCHQQFSAFAHLAHDVSHGIDNKLGSRNSPGLANVAWLPSFFWDGGVNHIEVQPIAPIENPVEMDLKFSEAVARVAADPIYRKQFEKAFGSDQVTSQLILRAMAQFMGAMVSSDSKYDKVIRNSANVSFTAAEQRGLNIFRQQCATCHKEPLFTDFTFRNNGLQPKTGVNDSGRAHITLDAFDLYKFKVPSLRNVAVTAPYMHDGRIATLEDAVEHYRTGIFLSPTIDPIVQSGLRFSDGDKADIVSFLLTLTDSTFLKNPIFADPNQ